METVGEVLDEISHVNYDTILPYFTLPAELGLKSVIPSYINRYRARRMFNLTHEHLTGGSVVYHTRDINRIVQQVYGTLNTLFANNPFVKRDFYTIYDNYDENGNNAIWQQLSIPYAAAQRALIIINICAIKAKLTAYPRTDPMIKMEAIKMPEEICYRVRRRIVDDWMKVVPDIYKLQFNFSQIKTYIADVAVYKMFKQHDLISDATLQRICCDTAVSKRMIEFRNTSPVCVIPITYGIIQNYHTHIANLKKSIPKHEKFIKNLIIQHNGHPHEEVNQARIKQAEDVYNLRYYLQIACIYDINLYYNVLYYNV
jgi:hypothetical protein